MKTFILSLVFAFPAFANTNPSDAVKAADEAFTNLSRATGSSVDKFVIGFTFGEELVYYGAQLQECQSGKLIKKQTAQDIAETYMDTATGLITRIPQGALEQDKLSSLVTDLTVSVQTLKAHAEGKKVEICSYETSSETAEVLAGSLVFLDGTLSYIISFGIYK